MMIVSYVQTVEPSDTYCNIYVFFWRTCEAVVTTMTHTGHFCTFTSYFACTQNNTRCCTIAYEVRGNAHCIYLCILLRTNSRIRKSSLIHGINPNLKMSETYLFRWATVHEAKAEQQGAADSGICLVSSSIVPFGCSECITVSVRARSREIPLTPFLGCVCLPAYCVCTASLQLRFRPVSPCLSGGVWVEVSHYAVVACSFLSHPAPQEWI